MTFTRNRMVAGVIAAAALAGAAPAAQAQPVRDCDAKLERLETRFRQIEERRGYEAATEWWYGAWQRYYKHCVAA
jgi:hypothetical protein